MPIITPDEQGLKFAKVRVTEQDTDTIIIEAVPGKKIVNLGYSLMLDRGGTLIWKDTSGNELGSLSELPTHYNLLYPGGYSCPAAETAVGEGMVLVITGATGQGPFCTGHLTYREA